MSKPEINVTPLIDVLLVLLIIFMIVAPQKPSDFKTQIPQENKDVPADPNPHTLVVAVNSDSTLRLNTENNLGSINNPEALIERLRQTFQERFENRVYNKDLALKKELSESDKIQKTVFIKAPTAIEYGKVAKVIDAVKMAGANPIALQIDDLSEN